MGFGDRPTPLMKGWLKASHRTLDSERSTEYSPKHTHSKAELYAPLASGELAEVEIELIPNTGAHPKGTANPGRHSALRRRRSRHASCL